ncbi:MAG TPA: PspC domain-containing protein [Glaciibacter sp.]|nr:PspC domain-containing protein [Glaciibacter sp.]
MTDAPHSSPQPPRTAGGNDGQQQLTRFFDWIRSSGMLRGDERWFAGVCGAVAGRTGLDPLIVRGIAVVVAILGGPVLFAYAVGWALLPNARGEIHTEQAFRGVFEPAMVAIAALLVFTFVPFTRGVWWEGAPLGWGMPEWLAITLSVGWGIAVTVGIVWLVVFLLTRKPSTGKPGGSPSYGSHDGYGSGGSAPGTTNFAEATAPVGAAATGPFSSATIPYAFPPAPPVPPAPDADAPRSAWDEFEEQNRAWQEQNRQWKQERSAWRALSHEWMRHRHPGAGFTAILLGLALVTGAIAAGILLTAGSFADALLVGLAVTLGVLALGIIVAGIRGRDSGALGGFAFLAVLGLVFLGVFPQGTQFTPFGSPNWATSSSSADADPGYAIIAGRPTIDLTALDNARSGDARVIDVWLGFGRTDLILPEDRAVRIESNTFIGSVDYDDEARTRGGMFFHDSRTPNGNSNRDIPEIRVWTFIGQVTVIDPTR